MTPDPDPALGPQVVLHEEHLQVATTRHPTDRVIVRRVITTQTRQIEVTVRREELRLERQPASDSAPAITERSPSTQTARPTEPALIIVLSQEEPVVHLQARPYEQVSIHIDTVTDHDQVDVTLSHEQAEVLTDAGTAEQPAR